MHLDSTHLLPCLYSFPQKFVHIQCVVQVVTAVVSLPKSRSDIQQMNTIRNKALGMLIYKEGYIVLQHVFCISPPDTNHTIYTGNPTPNIMDANLQLSNAADQPVVGNPNPLDYNAVICERCVVTTTQPFCFKRRKRGGIQDAFAAEVGPDTPYCLDCSEHLARVRQTNMGRVVLLSGSSREKELAIINCLMSYSGVYQMRLLADRYTFCRCCLNPMELVDAPGEPCDACRGLPRCCACGRNKKQMRQYPEFDSPMCVWCRSHTQANTTPGPVAADADAEDPRPRIRCNDPTSGPRRQYCWVCQNNLNDAPGEKCWLCDSDS